jgi:hypothetical protein
MRAGSDRYPRARGRSGNDRRFEAFIYKCGRGGTSVCARLPGYSPKPHGTPHGFPCRPRRGITECPIRTGISEPRTERRGVSGSRPRLLRGAQRSEVRAGPEKGGNGARAGAPGPPASCGPLFPGTTGAPPTPGGHRSGNASNHCTQALRAAGGVSLHALQLLHALHALHALQCNAAGGASVQRCNDTPRRRGMRRSSTAEVPGRQGVTSGECLAWNAVRVVAARGVALARQPNQGHPRGRPRRAGPELAGEPLSGRSTAYSAGLRARLGKRRAEKGIVTWIGGKEVVWNRVDPWRCVKAAEATGGNQSPEKRWKLLGFKPPQRRRLR